MSSPQLQNLLEQYGAIGLERQRAALDFVEDKPWNVDLSTGEITFGGNLVLPMQILGSFSHGTRSWMWAWANTQMGSSAQVMATATKMRMLGVERSIPEFTEEKFPADENLCHQISLAVLGLSGAGFYYAGNYGQGTAFMTADSPLPTRDPAVNPEAILAMFPRFISIFEVNHKNALRHYCQAKGFTVIEGGSNLTADKGRDRIFATFDELGRLSKLNGELDGKHHSAVQ